MSADFKRCGRCEVVKPAAEFYIQSAALDGLQHRCKVCHREVKRLARHTSQGALEAARADVRNSWARHSERRSAEKRAWRLVNAEKVRAHNQLNYAVLMGRVTRPDGCERCASTRFAIQAHHEDYSKSLDVEWLCAPCHAERHGWVAA